MANPVRRSNSGTAISLVSAALALTLPQSVRAQPLVLLNAQVSQVLLTGIGTGSACTLITYDKNGNRTVLTVSTIGAGPVQWGSGVYGCYVWKAP